MFSIKKQKIKPKRITIGIPRALSYYEHGPVWERFFQALGFDVILSGKTNIDILNQGVISCNNETCLPVKVFHGHILALKDHADYIFIPRYSSTCASEYHCPKLCALPDMAGCNIKDTVNILEIKINENAKKDTLASLKTFSETLGLDYPAVLKAFLSIVHGNLKTGDLRLQMPHTHSKKTIAVLGHPYMIYDEYLSMNLIQKITGSGYAVRTPIDFETDSKRANAYPYNGRIKTFFSVGIDNLGSAYSALELSDLCGIIYLTPFACGVDAVVIELIERGLKGRGHIPWMKLTIDEHTGEAGFDTRLEAFMDMIVS